MSAEQQQADTSDDAADIEARVVSPPAQPLVMTLEEVAEGLKVSNRWLRTFIRSHPVPVLRCGRQWRFTREGLNRLKELLEWQASGSSSVKIPAHFRSQAPIRSQRNASAKLRELAATSLPRKKQQPSTRPGSEKAGTAHGLELIPLRRPP